MLEFISDLLQLGSHFLLDRLPNDRKFSILGLPTAVSETKELEALRSSFIALLSPLRSEPPEQK